MGATAGGGPSEILLKKPKKRRMLIFRIAVLAVVLGSLALLGHHLGEDLPELEAWIKHQGGWAPFIFVILFLLLPVISFPTDVLCFAAGALFGMWPGFLLATVGIYISATLMFFIARYFARGWFEKFFNKHPRFKAIDQAFSKKGIKIIMLLRFAPVPFAIINYFSGVSRITFKAYFITIFATFLSVTAGVYYGFVARHVTRLAAHSERLPTLHYVMMFGGMLIFLVTMAIIAHEAHKALDKVVKTK